MRGVFVGGCGGLAAHARRVARGLLWFVTCGDRHHSLCMVLATPPRPERAHQHAAQTHTKQNFPAVAVVSWFQIIVVVS